MSDAREFLLANSRPMVACSFDDEGTVLDCEGNFLDSEICVGSNIYDVFDFIFGIPDGLAEGEVLAIEGVHRDVPTEALVASGSEKTEVIFDALVSRLNANCFILYLEDKTEFYRTINVLSQQRNEADILRHQLLRQNDQLIVLKQAAESARRQNSEFLATISHEIRTPLNAMIGFADLLATTEVTSRQKNHIAKIKMAGESLSAMLNDLLDLTKMESGNYRIENAGFSFD